MLLSEGSTKETEGPVPCACPRIYFPVCASDGKTYSNSCIVHCTNKRNGSNLKIMAKHACPKKGINEGAAA